MIAEIQQIDIDAAQRRAERIRFHATNANEAMQSLQKLVHTARELEDHVTLGYASWPAYVTDLFGNEPLRLARDVRRELVAELADAGMSTRAIAPIVGVHHDTVATDIKAAVPVGNPTPAPVEVEGFTVDQNTGEIIDGPPIHAEPTVTEHTVTERVKTVTGLDGKEYKRPEPKPAPAPKAVLEGDTAKKYDAVQFTTSLVRGLSVIARLEGPNMRGVLLNEYWPLSEEEHMPAYRALVTPQEIRKAADNLTNLAADMEAHNDYR